MVGDGTSKESGNDFLYAVNINHVSISSGGLAAILNGMFKAISHCISRTVIDTA